MNKKASGIQESCKRFYAMIPDVTTDLDAIPYDHNDKNYVDEWLDKKRKEIRGRNSLSKSIGKMLGIMSEAAKSRLV